jgi:hypothetical protein
MAYQLRTKLIDLFNTPIKDGGVIRAIVSVFETNEWFDIPIFLLLMNGIPPLVYKQIEISLGPLINIAGMKESRQIGKNEIPSPFLLYACIKSQISMVNMCTVYLNTPTTIDAFLSK